MTQLKSVCDILQMSQAEAPLWAESTYASVRDYYREKLRSSQQDLLDKLETLRRRKVQEIKQLVRESDNDKELKDKLNNVVDSLDGLIEMLQENRARKEELFRSIESLKSFLDDSIFALKRQNATSTTMAALKKIERDVSTGYDQFVEAYKLLRNHLRRSISRLENSRGLWLEEGWLMAIKVDYQTDIGDERGDFLPIQILDLDTGYHLVKIVMDFT